MLRELIIHAKMEFNALFQEKARQKQDEITKIEDKNERIREILRELQIEEKVFSATIHDEEAPERTLEVKDSEIKVQKVITKLNITMFHGMQYVSPEELKRLEDARRAEEERLRANQDDSRERALMAMMGGRLEDRYVIIH